MTNDFVLRLLIILAALIVIAGWLRLKGVI